MFFCKKTLFRFFGSSSASLYIFFSSTWFERFLCLNKFLNLCFQGACKQRQTSTQRQARTRRQANNLSFFICNGFEIWFFGRRSNSWNFWAKRGRTFSKQHFLGFSFTYILFFQRVCVFVSMSVGVWSGMCLFLLSKASLKILLRKKIIKWNSME